MSKTDMVRAYTESLLEQLLGIDRLRADHDGDYPVRYQSALYYVRIDPGSQDDPVVRVFAIALAEVESSPELFKELNGINTQLRFARIFWVANQVLIEAEMPGETLSFIGFASACNTVASAADHFGPRLADKFGGKTAFADEKDPNYESPSEHPGQYL